MSISPSSVSAIMVRRSLPYLFLISINSSLMILSLTSSWARTFCNSLIRFRVSFKSSIIFCRSSPVRRCRRISRMALAWVSDNSNSVMSPSRAEAGSSALRISWTTSSRFSSAAANPSRICSFSRALFKSNSVLRVTTSLRNRMKWCKNSFRLRTLGC